MVHNLEGLVEVILDQLVGDKSFSNEFLDSTSDLIKHIVTECPQDKGYFYDDFMQTLMTPCYQEFMNESDILKFNDIIKISFDYWKTENNYQDPSFPIEMLNKLFSYLYYDPSQLNNLQTLFNSYEESPLFGRFCRNLIGNLESVNGRFISRCQDDEVDFSEIEPNMKNYLNNYLNNLFEFYSKDCIKNSLNKSDYEDESVLKEFKFQSNLNSLFNEISSSQFYWLNTKERLIEDFFKVLSPFRSGNTFCFAVNSLNVSTLENHKWITQTILKYQNKLLDKGLYDETFSYLIGAFNKDNLKTEGRFELEIERILVNPNLERIKVETFAYYNRTIAPFLADSDFKNNLSMLQIEQVCEAYDACDSYFRSNEYNVRELRFDKTYRKFRFTYFNHLNEAISCGETPPQKIESALSWSKEVVRLIKTRPESLFEYLSLGVGGR